MRTELRSTRFRSFESESGSSKRVSRASEVKDARALKSQWWTLGCACQEVAGIGQWEDEQIEYIKEKVTEEGRQAYLKKGKAPTQIALDEAAFLLDLASIEGTWIIFWCLLLNVTGRLDLMILPDLFFTKIDHKISGGLCFMVVN